MFLRVLFFLLIAVFGVSIGVSASQPSEIWNRIFKKQKTEKVNKKPTATKANQATINNIHSHNSDKENLILVDKSTKKLYLFEISGSDVKQLAVYDALFGENGGDKIIRGDKKTPEGVYYITDYKSEADLKSSYGKDSEIYGTGAFPINYPNPIDELRGKTGGGIWIHGIGVDNKKVTRGCVAMNNNDLDSLKPYIKKTTPVIIVDKAMSEAPTLIDNASIDDISSKAINKYLKEHNISKVYNDENYRIFMQNDSNFVIDFNLFACKDNSVINENVRLYIIADNGELYKDVDDKYMIVADESRGINFNNQFVMDGITKFFNDWLDAWSKQDFERYANFYSKDFDFYGQSYENYIENKSKLFDDRDKISISMSGTDIKIDGRKIHITANQDYKSDKLKTSGVKKLIIVGCPDNYKIIHESWSKR